uniref:Uncharacterized protein n=1 Tax=Arundo donax TaxID=35708 RepID=A0A0A9FYU1_ARUDO
MIQNHQNLAFVQIKIQSQRQGLAMHRKLMWSSQTERRWTGCQTWERIAAAQRWQ